MSGLGVFGNFRQDFFHNLNSDKKFLGIHLTKNKFLGMLGIELLAKVVVIDYSAEHYNYG